MLSEVCLLFPRVAGGPVLTPSFPQMQVQQLLQIKKQQQQQQAAAAAAAAQQKAGQPQQGQATVQQKVRDISTLHLLMLKV